MYAKEKQQMVKKKKVVKMTRREIIDAIISDSVSYPFSAGVLNTVLESNGYSKIGGTDYTYISQFCDRNEDNLFTAIEDDFECCCEPCICSDKYDDEEEVCENEQDWRNYPDVTCMTKTAALTELISTGGVYSTSEINEFLGFNDWSNLSGHDYAHLRTIAKRVDEGWTMRKSRRK